VAGRRNFAGNAQIVRGSTNTVGNLTKRPQPAG
jgi:hypothetical protein